MFNVIYICPTTWFGYFKNSPGSFVAGDILMDIVANNFFPKFNCSKCNEAFIKRPQYNRYYKACELRFV